MSLDVLTVAATSPATNTVPSAGLASSDSAPAAAAGHSHGLSKGAIAGIVIGSLAGAALLMTLATFVIIKVPAAVLLLLFLIDWIHIHFPKETLICRAW